MRNPENISEIMVRRVIGINYDNIEIKDGILIRNNIFVKNYKKDYKLDEKYKYLLLDKENKKKYDTQLENLNPIIIPKDSFFLLGDNFYNSFDSRQLGAVDKRYIIGRVLYIKNSY